MFSFQLINEGISYLMEYNESQLRRDRRRDEHKERERQTDRQIQKERQTDNYKKDVIFLFIYKGISYLTEADES